MLVIAMASQKGGSGKTTLSGHLAVEAEKTGAGPVAVIDTDPQGSLAAWWNARVEKTPAFAKVGAFDLQSALQHLERSGIRLAIIDTPAAITDAISHVIAHADLVIVPCRPSPHDLRAVGATVDLVDRHKKNLIFIVNAGTLRARITGEAAVALSQHGTVAPTTIHHRVDFAASMVDGRTVGEVIPNSQSAKEISDLWIYIQDRLSRIVKDPTLAPEHIPDHFSFGGVLNEAPEVEESEDGASYATPNAKGFAAPQSNPAPYANPAPRANPYAQPTASGVPAPYKPPTPYGSPAHGHPTTAPYTPPAPFGSPPQQNHQPAYANPMQQYGHQQPYTDKPVHDGQSPFASEIPLERRVKEERRVGDRRKSAEVPTLFGGAQRPSSTFGRRSTD